MNEGHLQKVLKSVDARIMLNQYGALRNFEETNAKLR